MSDREEGGIGNALERGGFIGREEDAMKAHKEYCKLVHKNGAHTSRVALDGIWIPDRRPPEIPELDLGMPNENS